MSAWIKSWTVVYEATGKVQEVELKPPAEPRSKVSLQDLYSILTGKVEHPAVRLGRKPAQFRYSGFYKGGFEGSEAVFRERVNEAQPRVRKRGGGLGAEVDYPTRQALLWYLDVIHHVPTGTATDVSKQLARLCGDDSLVTVPWRSLADAVGKTDKAGRLVAYTERGVKVLVEAGWLTVETIGRKRGAKTTFYLMPGDRGVDWVSWDDVEDESLEEVA